METTIFIGNDVINEVENFIETKLVSCMNDAGLSFPAMGFIIQALLDIIEDVRIKLNED